MERVNVHRNEDERKEGRGLPLISRLPPFKPSLFCGKHIPGSDLLELLIRLRLREFASLQPPSFVRLVVI